MFKYSLVLLFALFVAVAPLSFRGVTVNHEGEESLNHLNENSELVFTSLIAGEETGEEVVTRSRVLADEAHAGELVFFTEEYTSDSSESNSDSSEASSDEEDSDRTLVAGENDEERILRLIDESESSDNGETGNLVFARVLANEEESQAALSAHMAAFVSEEEQIHQVSADTLDDQITFFEDLNQLGWAHNVRRSEEADGSKNEEPRNKQFEEIQSILDMMF